MGFVNSKGFSPATNFVVKIHAVVYSEKYSIKGGQEGSLMNIIVTIPFKGYDVHIKKIMEDAWRDLFVPEAHIHYPKLFMKWLCKAHLRPRWKVQKISWNS